MSTFLDCYLPLPPLCVHIIRRHVRTVPCVVELPSSFIPIPPFPHPLSSLIFLSRRLKNSSPPPTLPAPIIPCSAVCFGLPLSLLSVFGLCGLKLYLGATVLCIHTYTYDLHVHLAISSASTVFLYPCTPSCAYRLCVYWTYPLEHVNVRRRMK